MAYEIQVECGDWLYPSRDSSCGIQYPIDRPLVAEIFLPSNRVGVQVAANKDVSLHLTGPRYMALQFDEQEGVLRLVSFGNRQEEKYHIEVNHDFGFNFAELPRTGRWPNDWEENAIFFTDVLLMAHLRGDTLPEQIRFRDALIPEIESIGKWRYF